MPRARTIGTRGLIAGTAQPRPRRTAGHAGRSRQAKIDGGIVREQIREKGSVVWEKRAVDGGDAATRGMAASKAGNLANPVMIAVESGSRRRKVFRADSWRRRRGFGLLGEQDPEEKEASWPL